MRRVMGRLNLHGWAEDGWVVVTAIVLMTIMLGVGLAVLATADTQSAQSRQERVRESAFNLAEGLMQAEAVVLQTNWPNAVPCATNDIGCGYQWSASDPSGSACTQLTAGTNPKQCPDPAKLVGSSGAFSNVDQSLGSTNWKIQVRDDLGACNAQPAGGPPAFYSNCQIPTYYKGTCPPGAATCWPAVGATQPPGDDQKLCQDASNVAMPCTWDANGNKQLWVRVDATVGADAAGRGGKTRSLVALLRLENFPITLNSKDAVNGGAINFGNSGNKNIVDANNSQIVTRCQPTIGGANPSQGKILSTLLAADVAAGAPTVLIPDNSNTQGFAPTMVVALGANTGDGGLYELLTIASNLPVVGSNPPTRQITFTTTVQHPHKAIDGSNRLELAPGTNNNCQAWAGPPEPLSHGADKHQLENPWNYKSDPNYPTFLSPDGLAGVIGGLKHWKTCPVTVAEWTGNVHIQSVPAGQTCTMPNGTINTPADPHLIVVENQAPVDPDTDKGTCGSAPALQVSGNTVFYGVIYMVNKQQCSYGQSIMAITAGAQIDGGVAIDGHASVDIGNASNSGNCAVKGGTLANPFCPTIKFDPVAFGSVAASGAAGLVQNTWRELAPNQ
jgi:hypothetical protein